MPNQTRIVLDTNTLMALWVFNDPGLAALRQALAGNRFEIASSAEAIEEYRRVLRYRQFEIPESRQAELLTDFTLRCVLPTGEGSEAPLPRCGDPDDQKFLELARNARASHLLTRDKLLLKLNRHRLIKPLFIIQTPESFQLACC